jgi:hypothetical protein
MHNLWENVNVNFFKKQYLVGSGVIFYIHQILIYNNNLKCNVNPVTGNEDRGSGFDDQHNRYFLFERWCQILGQWVTTVGPELRQD